jgi:hypothetical protein
MNYIHQMVDFWNDLSENKSGKESRKNKLVCFKENGNLINSFF